MAMYEEVVAQCGRLLNEESSNNLRTVTEVAECLFEQKHFASAQSLYERIIDYCKVIKDELCPEALIADYQLALVLVKLGNLIDAKARLHLILTKAIECGYLIVTKALKCGDYSKMPINLLACLALYSGIDYQEELN